MMRAQLPALYQFFAGYFNEDWRFDGQNAGELVQLYLKDAPHSSIQQVIDAIERLLEMNFSDKQLEDILTADFWCAYDPALDGMSYTEWVRWIKDTLKKGLEEGSELEAP